MSAEEDKNKTAGDESAAKTASGTADAASEKASRDEERSKLWQRAIGAERELEKIRKERAAEDEAKLKESGKWQELATKAESRSAALEKQLRRTLIEREIVSLGGKANDPEDLIPFVDVPDDLDVSDSKSLRKHIGDQVKKLSESKSYLFQPADVKTNNTKVATAPAAGDNFDPKKTSKSAMWGLSEQQLQKIREVGR